MVSSEADNWIVELNHWNSRNPRHYCHDMLSWSGWVLPPAWSGPIFRILFNTLSDRIRWRSTNKQLAHRCSCINSDESYHSVSSILKLTRRPRQPHSQIWRFKSTVRRKLKAVSMNSKPLSVFVVILFASIAFVAADFNTAKGAAKQALSSHGLSSLLKPSSFQRRYPSAQGNRLRDRAAHYAQNLIKTRMARHQ